MMGKTHYFIGMASAMLACQPNDEKTILLALAGGALGGVAADIDTVDNDYKCDALIGQLLGIGTASAMLAIDYLKPSGICSALFTSKQAITKIGAIAYLILMVIGFITNHRTFTHSFYR